MYYSRLQEREVTHTASTPDEGTLLHRDFTIRYLYNTVLIQYNTVPVLGLESSRGVSTPCTQHTQI